MRIALKNRRTVYFLPASAENFLHCQLIVHIPYSLNSFQNNGGAWFTGLGFGYNTLATS